MATKSNYYQLAYDSLNLAGKTFSQITKTSAPQKYGTVNGKTTLPSHIENQGLYDLNEKTKFDYFADSTAKSLVDSKKRDRLWELILADELNESIEDFSQ